MDARCTVSRGGFCLELFHERLTIGRLSGSSKITTAEQFRRSIRSAIGRISTARLISPGCSAMTAAAKFAPLE